MEWVMLVVWYHMLIVCVVLVSGGWRELGEGCHVTLNENVSAPPDRRRPSHRRPDHLPPALRHSLLPAISANNTKRAKKVPLVPRATCHHHHDHELMSHEAAAVGWWWCRCRDARRGHGLDTNVPISHHSFRHRHDNRPS